MKHKKFINNLIKPNKTPKNNKTHKTPKKNTWVGFFLIKPGFLPALIWTRYFNEILHQLFNKPSE